MRRLSGLPGSWKVEIVIQSYEIYFHGLQWRIRIHGESAHEWGCVAATEYG
jgi:hypothetical protein